MSRGGFKRPALLAVALVVSITFSLRGADGPAAAGPAAAPNAADEAEENPQPKWRTVARWFGNFTQEKNQRGASQRGVFGLALSSPGYKQSSSGNIVLREEVDDVLGMSRTVVESFGWASSVSDLAYEPPDGGRWSAGSGGGGGATLSGGDLAGPLVNAPEHIAQARQTFEQAREEYRRAKAEKQQAERDAAAAGEPGANVAHANMPPLQRAMIEDLERMQKLFVDPKATPAQRDVAMKKSQESSQAYNDWITKRSAEFEAKYTKELERLTIVMSDEKSTDAQKEEAGRKAQVLSDAMSKESTEMFGGPEPAVAARDRLEEATHAVENARTNLYSAAREMYFAENNRNSPVGASGSLDERDGRRVASVNFSVDRFTTRFPVAVKQLEIKQNVGGARMGVVVGDAKDETFDLMVGMSGQAEADENGGATVTDQHGEPGNSQSYTLSRVPVKQQLMFRGKLHHRIRVPSGPHPADHAVIMHGGTPVSLSGAIPVSGAVRVEARLYDPGALPQGAATAPAAAPAGAPPPVNVTDSADGAFELAVPLKAGKIARLTFVYTNPDAQVSENVHVDVPVDAAVRAWGTIRGTEGGTDGNAPLENLARHAEAWLRWETTPKLYPLGSETRGATVERQGDWHIVRFEGFNSVLINTFILAAPHLNQNRHTMEITARVPARRLMEARPALAPEAQLRARLGIPAPPGPVPEWTTAKVPVEGPVACFPTAVTMSLAGMGLINIPSNADRSDEIEKLAQGIYDWYSAKHAKDPWGARGMPELFPFPQSPLVVDAVDAWAAENPFRPVSIRIRRDLLRRYRYWPYIDGDDGTMKWLITTGGFRPWQWAWIVGGFIEDTYGINVEVYTDAAREHPEWRNIFAADPKKIAHVLGRGCGGVGSIRHISNVGEGGHLLAFQGVVTDTSGNIVRWIFHDPYGDQSRNPTVPGYYEIVNWTKSKYDRDPPERADLLARRGNHWGRYVPYGPDISSFDSTLVTKFWEVFEPKTAESPETMKKRLLPSVVPSAPAAGATP